MLEEDYQVDEKGERLPHSHALTVDEFYTRFNIGEDIEEDNRKPKISTRLATRPATVLQKTPSLAQSGQPTAKIPKLLPKTACPKCGKMITTKVLNRHLSEVHSQTKKFKCMIDNCVYTANRELILHDHQRRMHLLPTKQGRTKKNKKPPRKRSPFRKNEFESRYKNALGIIKNASSQAEPRAELEQETMKKNNEQSKQLQELKEKLASAESVNQINQQKMAEDAKKSELEVRKIKIRLSMVEAKQTSSYADLPDIKDTPGLLDFFKLSNESKLEDIRKVIGLRIMELSGESNVSQDIFKQSHITENSQKLLLFCNQAREALIQWRKRGDAKIRKK